MPPVRVLRIRWEDAPLMHLTRRATVEEIDEVFANQPAIYATNRMNHASTHKAVGRTDAGRRLVVPFIYLAETNEAVPITCWEEK